MCKENTLEFYLTFFSPQKIVKINYQIFDPDLSLNFLKVSRAVHTQARPYSKTHTDHAFVHFELVAFVSS